MHRNERITAVGLLLLLSGVLIGFSGYNGVYGANHPLQLVAVLKINAPHLFPNDALADTSFSYASLFWHFVAWLERYFSIESVLLLLFLTRSVLIVYAAYRLGRALFPEATKAHWGCMVFIAVPTGLLSVGNLVHGVAEQTAFALAFLLLGVAAFIERRWIHFGFWMGLVGSMNFLYAIYGVAYCAAALLLVERDKVVWSRFITAIIAAAVIAAPAISMLLRAARIPVYDTQAVWQVAELTYPPFFFPNTLGMRWHIVFWALVAVSLILAYFKPQVLHLRLPRYLLAWTLTALGWYSLAWATPYWLKSLTLLHLHPIRGVELWYCISGFVIAGTAAEWAAHYVRDKKHPWGIAAAGLLGATLWSYLLAHDWRFIALRLIGVFMLAEAARLILSRTLNTTWKISPYAVVLGVNLLLVSLSAAREHYHRVVAYGNLWGTPRYPAVEAIAQWARIHTHRDDVFIVPVHGEWRHFRYLSQRSVFVHRKDGDAWPSAPWYAAEWLRRMEMLGLLEAAGLRREDYTVGQWTFVGYSEWVRQPQNFYAQVSRMMNESYIAQLRQHYKLDYWITSQDVPTNYPVVYTFGQWKVVHLAVVRLAQK